MNINKAIQLAAEHHWLLYTEDSHKDKNGNEHPYLISHAYVKPDLDMNAKPIRLCTWVELYKMSRATFAEKLASLPVEQEAIA